MGKNDEYFKQPSFTDLDASPPLPKKKGEREFKLPDYEDLTKEQDQLVNWNRKDRMIVVGGPGTGKTTIALILAEKMKNENEDSMGLLLMFNRALANMSKQLTEIGVKTYHSWIRKKYRELYGGRIPGLNGDDWSYDWSAIEQVYLDINNRSVSEEGLLKKDNTLMMIDEGQDLPYGFYKFLESHYENIFVTADENQQINEENTTIEQIADALNYNLNDIKELTHNFRNTKQIANFANTFFTAQFGDSPTPVGDRGGELPVLYQYRNNFPAIIQKIIQRHKEHPKRLIGILTPSNDIKNWYYNAVVENGESIIAYNDGARVQHKKGGIVIINYQGAKGLEFDELFIADINEHRYNTNQPNTTKKELYVETTRPKDWLFILYNMNNPNNNILNLLTKDESILRRV